MDFSCRYRNQNLKKKKYQVSATIATLVSVSMDEDTSATGQSLPTAPLILLDCFCLEVFKYEFLKNIRGLL